MQSVKSCIVGLDVDFFSMNMNDDRIHKKNLLKVSDEKYVFN